MACCEECPPAEKLAIIQRITCPRCVHYAWASSTGGPARDAFDAWHHPACPLVRTQFMSGGAYNGAAVLTADEAILRSFARRFATAGSAALASYNVGDCDWMHPYDCLTTAFDQIKKIPGIGAVAELAEDFSNTAVGRIFFAMVAPSLLAGFFTNLPGIGMQIADTLGKLGPVATDMLPGLVRGERVDKVFVESVKHVVSRAASAGGAQGASEAMAMAGPYLQTATKTATAALESMGTTPAQIASFVDARRIKAGLKTAEDVLPPELQAEVDAFVAPYLAKLNIHALAVQAGVPDDLMQVAIDGVTRTMNYDPSRFLADGQEAARVYAEQQAAQLARDKAIGAAFEKAVTLTLAETISEPGFRDFVADLTAGMSGRDNLPGSSPAMSPRQTTAYLHANRPLWRYPAALYDLLSPSYVIKAALGKGSLLQAKARTPGAMPPQEAPLVMAKAVAYLSAADRGQAEEDRILAEQARQNAANAQALTTVDGMRLRASALAAQSSILPPGSPPWMSMQAEMRDLLARASLLEMQRRPQMPTGSTRSMPSAIRQTLDQLVAYYVAIARARGLA